MVKKKSAKKNSKDKGTKWVAGILGSLLLLLMMGGFASNFTNPGLTGYAIEEAEAAKGFFNSLFTEFLSPLATLIFGVGAESSEIIFAKTLIFFTIFGLIWSILSQIEFVGDNKGMSLFAIGALCILAVRFLTADIIKNLIIVPTDTFVVAIITIILFAGLFYFIEIAGPFRDYAIFRKVSWMLVGVAFLGVWWTIRKDVGFAPTTYVIGFFATLFLLFLDGTIHKSLAKGKVSKEKSGLARQAIIAAKTEIADWQDKLVKGTITQKEFNDNIKRLNKAVDSLLK